MFKYIWCDACSKLVVLEVSDMPAKPPNTHAAQDLCCSECKGVIATLHESSSPITEG